MINNNVNFSATSNQINDVSQSPRESNIDSLVHSAIAPQANDEQKKQKRLLDKDGSPITKRFKRALFTKAQQPSPSKTQHSPINAVTQSPKDYNIGALAHSAITPPAKHEQKKQKRLFDKDGSPAVTQHFKRALFNTNAQQSSPIKNQHSPKSCSISDVFQKATVKKGPPPLLGKCERVRLISCPGRIISPEPYLDPETGKLTDLGVADFVWENDKTYPLLQLGKGQAHRVFKFAETHFKSGLKINGEELNLDSVVVKVPYFNDDYMRYQNRFDRSLHKITNGMLIGYDYLKKSVPELLPVIHFVPYKNSVDGGFWIIEKLIPVNSKVWRHGKVENIQDVKAKQVLSFAKHWLQKAAEAGHEILPDFRPENVMWKPDGKTLCVSDWLAPEHEDGLLSIFPHLLRWSNGNEHVWNYLVEDFPEEAKKYLTDHLNDKDVRSCLKVKYGDFGSNFPDPYFKDFLLSNVSSL